MKIIKKILLTSFFRIAVLFCVILMFSLRITSAIEIMNVDDITPGMKGYGKTVFKGKKIEVFNVEILGVLKNWEARNDMILIKMTGGPLIKTGIIAGMSGSPVYIENKLVGAVSHGWSFAKEAIAGVTPISAMMDVLKMESEIEDTTHAGTDNRWSAPLNTQDEDVISELKSQGILLEERLSKSARFNQPFTIDLVPIHTPLIVSGFDNRSLRRLSPVFSKLGWFPFQGSKGGANNPTDLSAFVPGAAVAVEMIRGDLNASAIGTVTYRDGNDILAFGHPLIQAGTTDLPMSTAYVYTILASQAGSVKMAVPGKIIGKVTQDRRSGISGRLGEYTQMIHCQADIKGSLNVNYNFDIVHDKLLTPNLVQMAVESALLATEKSIGEKSVNLKLDIVIADREEPVTIENVYYDPGPAWFPIYKIVEPITTLLNNKFQTVRIKSIKLTADIIESRNTASIENIRISKKWVNPGDEICINVKLKPFTQESVSIPLKITIPDDIARGSRIKVYVCDANYSRMLDITGTPARRIPTNFKQLINNIEDVESNNNLIVRIRLNKKGLTYMGESFPSLPNSFLNIMSLSNQSGVARLQSEIIKRVKTNWLVTGKQSINLFVENNG